MSTRRAVLFSFVVVTIVASLSSRASAVTSQTVAVMPFRDLSGAKASIGEAIRETVTSDLREISGMKVIERGNLDRVLQEQKLQGTSDFDTATSAKVGKLLGATLIVTGAYQKAATSVRLTARFVKVETGEIVGSAKVDGAQGDFLSLQDKVTAELLKSAGMEKKTVQKVATRSRPKIKSLRAVEIYGDAVIEVDDEKKKALLKMAIKEDPQFHYAVHDLDELEKRLKAYDSVNLVERERATQDFKKKIATEKNPMMVYSYYAQYIGALAQQHKWRTLAAECKAIVDNAPADTLKDLKIFAHSQLITAYMMLKDDDALLREGEKFLALYPGNLQYQGVRAQMDAAIDRKREADENKAAADKAIAELAPALRGDLCMVAVQYNSNKQYREARAKFEECQKAGGSKLFPPGQVEQFLVIACHGAGDFKAARAHMRELEKVDPKLYRSFSSFEQVIPID